MPTLILTPSHDELIGEQAATTMREGIPDATEVVLEPTGHMFRFTHPGTYDTAIQDFLAARALSPLHRHGHRASADLSVKLRTLRCDRTQR